MRLVIDANILIAALLKDATTREIILKEELELFAPECLLAELNTLLKSQRIRKRIPLSDRELSGLASTILSRIIFVPEESFLSFVKLSIALVAHIEDAPYLALSWALKLPLWSNDTALREQSAIKVYTTVNLLDMLT